jgi:hypothetical protein
MLGRLERRARRRRAAGIPLRSPSGLAGQALLQSRFCCPTAPLGDVCLASYVYLRMTSGLVVVLSRQGREAFLTRPSGSGLEAGWR